VHRELAGDGVAQVGENGVGMYYAMADSAEELAPLETLFADGNGL